MAAQPDITPEVAKFLAQGHALGDIREFIRTQRPEAEPDQVIAEALRSLEADARRVQAAAPALAVASFRSLARQLEKLGDFAGAGRINKEAIALAERIEYASPGTSAEAAERENIARLID